jgi:hypothetical protein
MEPDVMSEGGGAAARRDAPTRIFDMTNSTMMREKKE